MSNKDDENLPDVLPIFPLSGVLLLPRGHLPLNIFEPRYMAMVNAALKTDRMIGMIQPVEYQADELYKVGCAGRIISFEETDDGRYLITLEGVSRFHVAAELESAEGYRRVKVSWDEFKNDNVPMKCLDLDKPKLVALLEGYFEQEGLSCSWDAIEESGDEKLITCLSMICPFDAKEKQVLLEAGCCKERAQKFMTMLDMAVQGVLSSELSDTQH